MLKLEAMPAQMPKNPRIGHGLFLLAILVDLDQGVIGLTMSANHAGVRPLTALAQASQAIRPAASTGRRSHTQELLIFGLYGFIREGHEVVGKFPIAVWRSCAISNNCRRTDLPSRAFCTRAVRPAGPEPSRLAHIGRATAHPTASVRPTLISFAT